MVFEVIRTPLGAHDQDLDTVGSKDARDDDDDDEDVDDDVDDKRTRAMIKGRVQC